MTDDRWVIDRFLTGEREMGALTERLRAAERVDIELRQSLSDGLRAVGDSVLRESAHTRGEIARLDILYQENRRADEAVAQQRRIDEAKRNENLIATLRAQAQEAESAAKEAVNRSRPFVALVVFGGLVIQWVVEHLPLIVNLME